MRVRVGSFRFNVSLSFTAAAEQMDGVRFFFFLSTIACEIVFSLFVRVVFLQTRAVFQNKSTGKGQPSVAQATEVQVQFSILCL